MNLESPTPQDLVELFQQAASSVEEVAGQFDEGDWDLPTDCPGWSVKDQLSHLVSYESAALGRPTAPEDIDVSSLPHVKDKIGEGNEREVEIRRGRSGAEVLAEYHDVMSEWLKQMPALDQTKELAEGDTPIGMSGIPWGKFLPVRIADLFFHEQDIRRAADKPGHLNGAVARAVFERMATYSLPRFGKWVKGLPEGTVVTFDVEQPGRSFAITAKDGKGTLVETPSDPAVRLSMDFEAFFLLIGGRKTPEELKRAGRLRIEGDDELAESVLAQITVIP